MADSSKIDAGEAGGRSAGSATVASRGAVSPLLGYAPALRRYFRRRVDAADVEDLVHDVLLSIEGRSSPEAIEHIEGYLFTVAANALSRHRRLRTRRWSMARSLGMAAPAEDILTPERRAIARDELDKIRAALLALTDRTREIFFMHRFEHLTYAAIAARLGISASAVEKHMMKAIRAILASSGDEA